MKKILSLLVLLPIMVFGQTQTENYIKNKTYKVATTTSISAPTASEAIQNITYFDGLGRPIQRIAHQQSGTGKDIVTPIEYDAFGRQPKDYLPYVPSATASLDYNTTALTDVFNFPKYSGQNPYSEKEFEKSPLNRLMKQAAPGTDWAMNGGHEIKLDYQINTTTDAVKLFSVMASWDATKGLYDIPSSLTPSDYTDFQLYKTITYDENKAATPIETNGSTVEFKNKEGQVVLKRTYESSVKHDTYYVYDQYGNLTFVIPPLADASSTITQTILDGLCYQYKYDYSNRLVEKKLPGKLWEYIVYDKLDRPVTTGPAFSPFSDSPAGAVGWLITKYDVFNRPVYTGWYAATVSSTTRASLQNDQNSLTTPNFETKTSSGTIDSITAYYTNTAAPTTFKLLTVNYYDDYVFPNIPFIPTNVEGQNVLSSTKGMPTGSWVRALTTATSTAGETAATFYDTKARPIRTHLTNYLGGYTYTDTNLDFSGVPQYTTTYHKRLASSVELKTTEVFTYSPQGRLLTHTHQVNTLPVQLLAENTYDELGQLISKNVGNTSATPLQKVDYAYNIRGWLTGINNDPTNNLIRNTTENDLFAFKINYNIIAGTVAGVKALYNGNIAETYWRTGSDNALRKYGYEYDNLNRLKNATYQKPENVNPVTNMYNENLTYDKNGNILSLFRNGNSDAISGTIGIDNLTYNYTATSNKLLSVLDNTNNTSGFKDGNIVGDDYTYDANGNMITDKNKGITAITYNHLNLPTTIVFTLKNKYGAIVSGINKFEYLYTSQGKKLQKIAYEYNSITSVQSTTITDYLSGFQYNTSSLSGPGIKVRPPVTVLQFFPTAEGYFEQLQGAALGTGAYVYNYTDHLGSIRLSYKDTDNNGTISSNEILEENNYYPFGLKHKGYNSNNTQPTFKYKYNGKELQDELGLNMYDYGNRMYDPADGRWWQTDEKAEFYVSASPYSYALNNPVNAIDPDGKLVIFVNGYFSRAGNIVGIAPGAPLKPYWDFFSSQAINSARDFLGASSKEGNYFVDGSSYVGFDQSGGGRYDNGYAYAEENYTSIISQMAEGETLKFVGHSEGSAFAAGMMAYFLDRAMNDASTPKVESSLHLSPDEADEFSLPDYGGFDYQIHNGNDFISPFYPLKGAEYIYKGKKESKIGAHGGTVSKKAINKLRAAIETFINSSGTKKKETEDGTFYYNDPAEQ